MTSHGFGATRDLGITPPVNVADGCVAGNTFAYIEYAEPVGQRLAALDLTSGVIHRTEMLTPSMEVVCRRGIVGAVGSLNSVTTVCDDKGCRPVSEDKLNGTWLSDTHTTIVDGGMLRIATGDHTPLVAAWRVGEPPRVWLLDRVMIKLNGARTFAIPGGALVQYSENTLVAFDSHGHLLPLTLVPPSGHR